MRGYDYEWSETDITAPNAREMKSMPVVYRRFLEDKEVIYTTCKELLKEMGFAITAENSDGGSMHAHKDGGGRMTHVDISVGGPRNRGVVIEVQPGGEGKYRDVGLKILDALSKSLR